MKKRKEKVDRIEEVLTIAHRGQAPESLPPDWRQNVMRDIRRLHDKEQPGDIVSFSAPVFRRMILPFATATGLAAVVLLVYVLTAVPGMEQDLLNVLTADPSGLLSTQALGL
jgi:hypothetical protein